MLADLIQQHAMDLVDEGDFGEVAKRLNAKTIPVKIGKVGGKATLSTLLLAGIDPRVVVSAMRSDPLGNELMDTLTTSGVDWDDDLTKYVMGTLVQTNKITQQVATIVRGLSLTTTSLAGVTVTAEQCSKAWESHRLAQQWATIQNEAINPVAGDRVALVAALKSAIETLEKV